MKADDGHGTRSRASFLPLPCRSHGLHPWLVCIAPSGQTATARHAVTGLFPPSPVRLPRVAPVASVHCPFGADGDGTARGPGPLSSFSRAAPTGCTRGECALPLRGRRRRHGTRSRASLLPLSSLSPPSPLPLPCLSPASSLPLPCLFPASSLPLPCLFPASPLPLPCLFPASQCISFSPSFSGTTYRANQSVMRPCSSRF